jgi:hypothetical protein
MQETACRETRGNRDRQRRQGVTPGKSSGITYHLFDLGVHDIISYALKAVGRRSHLYAKVRQVRH